MENIIHTLFPEHVERHEILEYENNDTQIFFTEFELKAAASALKNQKAPGPDGVPSEVLKIITEIHPQLLLNMYNACLKE